MVIRKPRYYDLFRCAAGACPDSCCHEWEVQVDENSARRYLALTDSLGDALRAPTAAVTNGKFRWTRTPPDVTLP